MDFKMQFRVRQSLQGIHWLRCRLKSRSLLRDCNLFFLHSITTAVAIRLSFLCTTSLDLPFL